MFQKLIALEWKAFFRSDSVGRSLAIKIFLGFIGLYFILVFLTLGVSLYALLEENIPDEAPVSAINSFLLVWFTFELVLRFMLQNLPIMHIKPLLLQKVNRGQMAHFLLGKSIFSFYNLLAPLVFVPFALTCYYKGDMTLTQVVTWLIAVLSIVFTLNFANTWIKKKFAENIKALLPFLLCITVVVLLDYFEIYSFSGLIGNAFDAILESPVLTSIPILLLVLSYIGSYRSLKRNIYLDSYVKSQGDTYRKTDLSWTSRFGKLAPFIQLDLQLIQRNKRSRATVLMSLLFLVYGLLFYTNSYYQNSSWMVFVGIFITGMFMINFGQFIPAWDSSYYSMLMAQNIPMKLYLNSKAMLLSASVVILTVLSTPYLYFGWDILFLNLACALFNMGANVPII